MKTYIFTPVVFALLLMAANICKAQDTIIGYSDNYIIDTRLELLTGTVTDASNGSGIGAALILLTGQSQHFEVYSNDEGNFQLGPAGTGMYVLNLTKPGYNSITESVNITGEPGQTLDLVMDPADNFTVSINPYLTVNANNVSENPTNYFRLTGDVNINEKLFFGGELIVDMRQTTKWVSGSGTIYVPDVDGQNKYISDGNNVFSLYAKNIDHGLYASGPGSFFPMPSLIGGFPVKAAAIVLPPSSDDVVVKTIPNLPYPVDVVFERYLSLGLPTKNLLDYISATFVYTVGGTENIEINISNLSANLGPVGIENLNLYYYSDSLVYGGNLTLKISSEKKDKDPAPDTTKVVIKDEYGDYLTEMTMEELIGIMQSRNISTLKIFMGIEFVSGALNSLEIGFSTNIPIFTTGLFITYMQGGVHDLAAGNWFLDANVEIEPGPANSPVTIAGNIMIQPMDVFKGGGNVTIFGIDAGGSSFEYNRPLKSVSLEVYYLAYMGILRGDIYAGLQGSQFTGSGLMTVKTPNIHCSFFRPWLCWISWAGNRHIGSAQIDINNTRMQSMVWVKAGKLGTLSLAQRLEYGSGFDYYIGTNYNRMVKLFKGTRDGMHFENFLVPENTASIMISANDTLTYEMFDFTIMSPDSIYYDHTYEMYECFEDQGMCVMVINLPIPGEWDFFTDYEGNVSLFTQALDQAPTAMLNQPEDRRTRNNDISLTLNDYSDTLNVQVYYNSHNREFNGTLINEFTVINNATLNFTWNNADVANGEYFIYTRIDDDKNAPVLQYAPGSIWVENGPSVLPPQNLYASQVGDSIMVSWDDHDTDYIYAAAVYYRDMSTSMTRQTTVFGDNEILITDLTPGRGYEIWAEFITDEGTYSSSSNSVEVIFTSQERNNPPFFVMDRDSTFVFVSGEAAQYTLHAMDADGDALGFYLPGDTLGVSIAGDQIFWTPDSTQTGVFNLMIVVSDGAATDTTYQRLVVYMPEQVNPQLAFNSVHLYELDNTFLKLRNFRATEPTQNILITNLRTGDQTLVVARKVNPFEYIGQFYVSVQTRSDVMVADGDTIVASYAWKNDLLETMAFYNINPQDSDTIPPGTINDLTAERLPGNKVKLRWTATGNHGDEGKAYRYDMRYAFQPIESKDVYIRSHRVAWVSDPMPYPSMAGTQDSVVVNLMNIPGITEQEMIYFSILAEDEAQNRGQLSNSPGVTAVADPWNLAAQVQDVYNIHVSWEGPQPAESGEEGFSHYKLYRRYNNGGWSVLQQQLYQSNYTDNLKLFPDGNYEYAVRAVFTSWESEMVKSSVIPLNRFVHVNILCELNGAQSNAGIHFVMSGLDDFYAQEFERTTTISGLVMLNNVFKSDYVLEMSKEQYVTLTDSFTVTDMQNEFVFTMYCDPVTPLDLVALENDLQSVLLDWNTQSIENQWDISYGPAGFDPDLEGILIEGLFSKPFNLTGLMPGVEHDIYIRAVCGEYVSEWSQPISILTSYAILATAGEGGSIIPEGLIAVAPGENFSFAIVPGEGHYIADVLMNDESLGAIDSYEFTNVAENFAIHAEFALKVYAVNATANNPDFGTISGAGDYEHFSEVQLTAISATGYHFLNWTEYGEEVATDSRYTFIAESDRDLIAHFAINVYTITAVPNNMEWGAVEGGGDYEHGQDVTLEALPASNYVFLRWTENEEEIGDMPEYSFTALSPRNLKAHFDPEVLVADMISNEVVIYPNPFTETITIQNASAIKQVVMSNLLGQVMLQKNLSGADIEIVNTASLPKGIYIVIFTDSDGYSLVRKLVKE